MTRLIDYKSPLGIILPELIWPNGDGKDFAILSCCGHRPEKTDEERSDKARWALQDLSEREYLLGTSAVADFIITLKIIRTSSCHRIATY